MDNHLKNFGPRLRALVESRGTAEAAFREIGVSRATLFNWFNRDEPPPGREKLEKLERWLGDDAPWILDGIQKSNFAVEEPLAEFGESLRAGHPLQSRSPSPSTQPPARSGAVISPSDAHTPRIPESPPSAHDVRAYVELLLDATDGDPKRVGRLLDALHEQWESTRQYWLKNPSA